MLLVVKYMLVTHLNNILLAIYILYNKVILIVVLLYK